MSDKIFLRIPTPGPVDPGVTRWLMWLERTAATNDDIDLDADLHDARCFGVAEARNDIFGSFLRSDADYLWMVDSDVEPPRSLQIVRTARKHPTDISSGLYAGKAATGVYWQVFQHKGLAGDGRHHRYLAYPVGHTFGRRWIECDAVGTGCMMIPRKVAELARSEIGPRPFHFEIHDDEEGHGTEDIVFCRHARDLEFWINDKTGYRNLRIIVDTHYKCAHYRDVNLSHLIQP
jgi:hypothetical protein